MLTVKSILVVVDIHIFFIKLTFSLLSQLLCEVGDITEIRNGKVPVHTAYGRAVADE